MSGKRQEAEKEQAAAKIYKNIFKRYKVYSIFISIDVKKEEAEREQAAAKVF